MIAKINGLLDAARNLLTGETAITITTGAGIVVWVATHVGYWLGILSSPPPSLDAISGAVAAALIAVGFLLRPYVGSGQTVALVGQLQQALSDAQVPQQVPPSAPQPDPAPPAPVDPTPPAPAPLDG